MSEETSIEVTPVVTPAADGITISAPPVEVTVEPPKTFTQEELQKHLDERMGKEKWKFERDLRKEREERIRLEERLVAAQPKAVAVEAKNTAPKLADFQDFEQYVAAVAAYHSEQAAGKATTASKAEVANQQAQMRSQQARQAYEGRVKEFLKERPDFQEVVSNTHLPLTPPMESFILESIHGPRLAVYLVDHPDEAEQIASSTPSGAARKLTLIEAGFTANVTKTPPPITPTGARSTTAVKSIADVTSQAEWEKRRREYRAKH